MILWAEGGRRLGGGTIGGRSEIPWRMRGVACSLALLDFLTSGDVGGECQPRKMQLGWCRRWSSGSGGRSRVRMLRMRYD